MTNRSVPLDYLLGFKMKKIKIIKKCVNRNEANPKQWRNKVAEEFKEIAGAYGKSAPPKCHGEPLRFRRVKERLYFCTGQDRGRDIESE
jgi:hypothetical protein